MHSAQDRADRRAALMKALPGRSIAIIPPSSVKPSTADASHTYAPSRNLYYLTGIAQENTWLILISNPSGEVSEILFTDPFDPEYEKWWGRKLTPEEATGLSGVTEVRTDQGWRSLLDRAIPRSGVEHVFVDYPPCGLEGHCGVRQSFARDLAAAWPDLDHRRLSGYIHVMRMKKDEKEIELLEEAARITGAAFEAVLAMLRPGVREYAVEAEIVRTIIGSGAREAFPVIAAGAGRATCLHYTSNDAVLESGDLLLIDFGAAWNLYSADITRTVPVNGRYSPRQRELMEIVLETQRDAIRLLRPGKTHAVWNQEVTDAYAARLVEAGVIPDSTQVGQVYYHRTGHHLGLDTHDEAVSEALIEPGMVFTVEPGLYIAGESTGIRIEDDVLVGEKENRILSSTIPRELSEIEAMMQGV